MFRTFLFCLNRNPGKCRLARTFVEIVGYDITARFWRSVVVPGQVWARTMFVWPEAIPPTCAFIGCYQKCIIYTPSDPCRDWPDLKISWQINEQLSISDKDMNNSWERANYKLLAEVLHGKRSITEQHNENVQKNENQEDYCASKWPS